MKCLVLIPARGGSKGVPKKNIKNLNGKPLIYYSIDIAKTVFNEKDICISTDDEEIIKCVENYPLKVPFVRPSSLALDTSGTYEVLLHAVSFFEAKGMFYDFILLLQPTSPFRSKEHIEDIMHLMEKNTSADMAVSVRKSKDNPYFNLYEEDGGGYLEKSKKGDYFRRQDCPPVYAFNGSLYLIRISSLKKNNLNQMKNIIKYVMEEELYNIDIDTPEDWRHAEQIIGL